MKVAFFGTSDKSRPILEKLKNEFELVLCVTKSDSKVGRKQELKETEVKKWAGQNNIKYVEIEKLDHETAKEISQKLADLGVEVGVVADFDYIIPSIIFENIPHGLINIHFSLLPKYRGASPVQHAILNLEGVTGVTYMLIDEGMDTGDILFQVKYGLKGTETTQELYDSLFDVAANYLPEVIWKHTSGELLPQKQDNKEATYCISPSHPNSTYIYKEDAKIDWNEPLALAFAKIRAFYPWPVAWSTLYEMKDAKIMVNREGILPQNQPSTEAFIFVPISSKNLRVKFYKAELIDKLLKILEVQPEGKKIMSWEDFINGYVID